MVKFEYLVLSLLLSSLNGLVSGGTVTLNGPAVTTEDLRAIDGYVSSGLPLFASTKGFILQSGMRPVIVKVKDPNKEIRDGIEQPNTSYYRNLPSVIPEGYEGIATTSFLLGHPIGGTPVQSNPSQLFAHLPQHQPQQFTMYRQYNQQQMQQQQQQQPIQQYNQQPIQQYSQQQMQQSSQLAEPSIRVENKIQPDNLNNQLYSTDGNYESGPGKLTTNPVVVQTSQFEANLPQDLQNPFYNNQQTAYDLARESLPAPGEEVVQKWDTNKIKQGRVRDLLVGAGFIS